MNLSHTAAALFAALLGPACLVEYAIGGADDRGDSSERELCEGDTCRCRDGLVQCGDACVDLGSDPAHCGECQRLCGAAELCELGACVDNCGPARTACDGGCVDLSSDPLHCDDCDKACTADRLCVAGGCRDYALIQDDACTTCPCSCAGDLDVCCHSSFLGALVCTDHDCD